MYKSGDLITVKNDLVVPTDLKNLSYSTVTFLINKLVFKGTQEQLKDYFRGVPTDSLLEDLILVVDDFCFNFVELRGLLNSLPEMSQNTELLLFNAEPAFLFYDKVSNEQFYLYNKMEALNNCFTLDSLTKVIETNNFLEIFKLLNDRLSTNDFTLISLYWSEIIDNAKVKLCKHIPEDLKTIFDFLQEIKYSHFSDEVFAILLEGLQSIIKDIHGDYGTKRPNIKHNECLKTAIKDCFVLITINLLK